MLLFLQSLLLIGTGTFMLALSLSDTYWHLLNPKYSWLTFSAGLVITVLAFAGLLARSRKPVLSELICLLLFLTLALASVSLPNPFFPAELASPDFDLPDFSGSEASAPEPRVTINGAEYIRINPGELLVLEDTGKLNSGDRYQVQGQVIRTPEMDRTGHLAVSRLLITCCIADAVSLAYLIKVDDPNDFESGEWVRSAGVILRERPALKEPLLAVTGTLPAISSEKFVILSERTVPAAPVGPHFLFEIREQEPFAF